MKPADDRAVHFVPTRHAGIDQRTLDALAQAGIAIASSEQAPAQAVVDLVSSRTAKQLAGRLRLPLLTLALNGTAGLRDLSLPNIAAAGRSVVVALVAISAIGEPPRQLVTGALKSSGMAPHLTRRRILESCADWPARALAATGHAAGPALRVANPTSAALTGWLSLPVHAVRNAAARLRDMATQETWAVGIAPRPVASFLARPQLDDVAWLPERSGGGFLADPFGLVGPDGSGPVGGGLRTRAAPRRNRGAMA